MMKQETDWAWSIGAVSRRSPFGERLSLEDAHQAASASCHDSRHLDRAARLVVVRDDDRLRLGGDRVGGAHLVLELEALRPDARGADADLELVARRGAARGSRSPTRARIMSRHLRVEPQQVRDPRLLEVGQEDGVVHVTHRVDVPKTDGLAVHEVEPLHAPGCYRAFHAASSSASRSASRPASSGRLGLRRACRERSPSSGRNVSPASTARETSVLCRPAPPSWSQSGSSIHSPTSCSMRKSPSTHTNSASLPATSRQVSESVSHGHVAVRRVERALGLAVRRGRTIHSPRSRTSMNWTGLLGRRRREHFAAARDAMGPVREAAGRVVRADDEPGADDRGRAAERLRRPRARRAPSARRSSRSRRASGRRAGRRRAPRAGCLRRAACEASA